MFLNIFIIASLIAINLFLIIRSDRKKKYGIYPVWISAVVFASLLGYYVIGNLIYINPERPALTKTKNSYKGLYNYEKKTKGYLYLNEKVEKNIVEYLKYNSYFFVAAKTQCLIAFIFSLIGLLFVEGRKNFYILTTISFLVLIPVLICLDYILN